MQILLSSFSLSLSLSSRKSPPFWMSKKKKVKKTTTECLAESCSGRQSMLSAIAKRQSKREAEKGGLYYSGCWQDYWYYLYIAALLLLSYIEKERERENRVSLELEGTMYKSATSQRKGLANERAFLSLSYSQLSATTKSEKGGSIDAKKPS